MGMSKKKVVYLRGQIDSLLKDDEQYRLTTACRIYKIPSAHAIEILKNIYPGIRQNSFVSLTVIEWINDKRLLDSSNKEKYLKRIPEKEQKYYKKYRVGREIKVRYRFKNKSKKYQDNKLQKIYCLGFYNYLKKRGY